MSIALEKWKFLNLFPSRKIEIETKNVSIELSKIELSKIKASIRDFVPTSIPLMKNTN